MHVSTDETIRQVDSLDKSTYAVLLHEYIHFLQDVTTVYGLGNISGSVNLIRHHVNQAYRGRDSGTVTVPLCPDPRTAADSAYVGQEIRRITWGDTRSCDLLRIHSWKMTHEPLSHPLSPVAKVPCVELKARCQRGAMTDATLRFGAGCLLESMAKIMERNMSDDPRTYCEFPYDAATKLAAEIYGAFAQNELNVLALCDLALNCSNPGKVFIDMLAEWKAKKAVPSDPRELYDDFYTREHEWIRVESVSAKQKTLETYLPVLEQAVRAAENDLKSYFKSVPGASDYWSETTGLINAWVHAVLDGALKWRKDKPYFMLDLAEGGKGPANKTFQALYCDMGMPFCTNSDGAACFYHPAFNTDKLHLEYFTAAHDISEILCDRYSYDDGCSLYRHCKYCMDNRQGNVAVDDRCREPWERGNTREDLCPFAAVWVHWGLFGITPEYNP